ncbi:MAG TPA: sialidase family protein, partial [Clostridia bacterium]
MIAVDGRLLKKAIITFLLVTALMFTLQIQSKADPLYSAVPVSDSGTTGNSISNANTSRCLAVAPDGTIYALYHGTNGIRVTKSTNRGASFSSSVLVINSNFESEIAVSSNGKVFVAWVDSGNAYVSVSSDGAKTFGSPVKVGTATNSVHMATDGNYLYLIDRPGSSFYSSSDGGQTFTKVTFSETKVFSDVHVNSLTGDVILQKDDPAIFYYISNDHGKTFSAQQKSNEKIYYSVGAISAGPKGTYLLVAGYSNMAARINLSDNTSKTLSFGSSPTEQGRSLSVDGFGNVVTGFVSSGNVYYAVSNDLGDTFGTTRTVATANMA